MNLKCKRCKKEIGQDEQVDGLCYSCFFSAEVVMDSIMDDLGIPKLMKISSELKKQLNGKRKVSMNDIVHTLLLYDEIDLALITDLIAGLPLSGESKHKVLEATTREYAKRHPVS